MIPHFNANGHDLCCKASKSGGVFNRYFLHKILPLKNGGSVVSSPRSQHKILLLKKWWLGSQLTSFQHKILPLKNGCSVVSSPRSRRRRKWPTWMSLSRTRTPEPAPEGGRRRCRRRRYGGHSWLLFLTRESTQRKKIDNVMSNTNFPINNNASDKDRPINAHRQSTVPSYAGRWRRVVRV